SITGGRIFILYSGGSRQQARRGLIFFFCNGYPGDWFETNCMETNCMEWSSPLRVQFFTPFRYRDAKNEHFKHTWFRNESLSLSTFSVRFRQKRKEEDI